MYKIILKHINVCTLTTHYIEIDDKLLFYNNTKNKLNYTDINKNMKHIFLVFL